MSEVPQGVAAVEDKKLTRRDVVVGVDARLDARLFWPEGRTRKGKNDCVDSLLRKKKKKKKGWVSFSFSFPLVSNTFEARWWRYRWTCGYVLTRLYDVLM